MRSYNLKRYQKEKSNKVGILRKVILISLILQIPFLNILLGEDYSKKNCPNSPVSIVGEINNVPSGCFDYYIFTQLWLPETCENYERFHVSLERCKEISKEFTRLPYPHGLWPNFYTTVSNQVAYPVRCTDEQFNIRELEKEVSDEIKKLYILDSDLPMHEWLKHGTCDGTSQNEYFKKLITYQQNLHSSRQFLFNYIGKSLPYEELIQRLGGEGYVNIMCLRQGDFQYLNQISANFDKENKPLKIVSSKKSCDQNKPVYIREFPSYN